MSERLPTILSWTVICELRKHIIRIGIVQIQVHIDIIINFEITNDLTRMILPLVVHHMERELIDDRPVDYVHDDISYSQVHDGQQ